MAPTTPFTAFRIENDDAGYRSGLVRLGVDDLNPGQVLIRAHWSSVNYKDALAGTGKGRSCAASRLSAASTGRNRGRQLRPGLA